MIHRSRWRGCRGALVLLVFGLVASGGAGTSRAAENAYVKGEITLNLRTGASPQHRIIGRVSTGERVTVLSRGDGWTQVRTPDGTTGWIPAGYLDDAPPPAVALERLQEEASSLRSRLQGLETSRSDLETRHEELVQREATQRAELERLATENRELKAGARWPEWITGATLLSVGMVVGALLARSGGRRQSRRIRL